MSIYYEGQRIDAPVRLNITQGGTCECVVDHEHDPESENAQSGIAVAQAIEQAIAELPSGNLPEKGVDYWTEEDKAEIKGYVHEAILNGEW